MDNQTTINHFSRLLSMAQELLEEVDKMWFTFTDDDPKKVKIKQLKDWYNFLAVFYNHHLIGNVDSKVETQYKIFCIKVISIDVNWNN